jgi:hypothetical protein
LSNQYRDFSVSRFLESGFGCDMRKGINESNNEGPGCGGWIEKKSNSHQQEDECDDEDEEDEDERGDARMRAEQSASS